MRSCGPSRQPALIAGSRQWRKVNIFLAPLAKAAGGTEKCGKAIFANKDDPDYKAILKTFDPIIKRYTDTPRMDMPGAKLPACPSPGK